MNLTNLVLLNYNLIVFMCVFLVRTAQGILIPNSAPQHRPRVRAVYHHQATADTQLSFTEGDIIALIGDKREGWQYGENLNTNKYVQKLIFSCFKGFKTSRNFLPNQLAAL